MVITEKTMKQWKALRSATDVTKMVSIYGEGAYPEMFHRAFRLGKCTDAVYEVMQEFYRQKAKMIKETW